MSLSFLLFPSSSSFFAILQTGWYAVVVYTGLFVQLSLVPCPLIVALEPVTACAQFVDCLIKQKLLKCPFLNILALVVLELSDILDGALEDGAFILLAAGNNLLELVDAFVDGLTTTALN
jgi:hypothetical protein